MSFIVALVLFSLGGLFSIYEGWHKLHSDETLSYPWVAVGILVFGIAAESVSLRACLHEVNKVRNGRSLWRWFRESRPEPSTSYRLSSTPMSPGAWANAVGGWSPRAVKWWSWI